jgi:hypothetical protein
MPYLSKQQYAAGNIVFAEPGNARAEGRKGTHQPGLRYWTISGIVYGSHRNSVLGVSTSNVSVGYAVPRVLRTDLVLWPFAAAHDPRRFGYSR